MKFDVGILSFLLAFIGATSGWVAWWFKKRQEIIQKAVALAEKELNDKRDFNHLVRNQEEISKNITYGFKDIENQMVQQNNEIREIKAYLIRNRNADKEN
ncbi:hypothetical protein [Nostoc sp. CHAB 5715]|uniref:hypothetical protein n=1 Tax=Nostoc sp. CHAB 5715 TaxID=2780400 RepID=UPI001E2EA3DC|nr:hypothetical protein [Nostoc sp. CHAB 5715]MCC5620716.1 hypothetical protein [Nostoc sp. CHAB 5715]